MQLLQLEDMLVWQLCTVKHREGFVQTASGQYRSWTEHMPDWICDCLMLLSVCANRGHLRIWQAHLHQAWYCATAFWADSNPPNLLSAGLCFC